MRSRVARLTDMHSRVYHAKRHLTETRVGILAGAIFFSMFALLDLRLFPEQIEELLLIRFLSLPLVALILLPLTWTRSYPRWSHIALSVGVVISGGALTLMLVITPGPQNYTYFAGIMVLLYFCYGLLMIPFKPAVVAGTATVLLHCTAVLIANSTPESLALAETFILLSVNIAGALVALYRDRLERRERTATHTLIIKQGQLTRANEELERRVEQRTAALSHTNADLNSALGSLVHKEMELEKKLSERTHLLQEIHHRVGNNLQTIGSMLQLERSAKGGKEQEEALHRMETRVRSMAQVHSILYELDDFSRISFGRIIVELAASHGHSNHVPITVDVVTDDVELDVDRAIPSALLVNELIEVVRSQGGESAAITLDSGSDNHARLTVFGIHLDIASVALDCEQTLSSTLVTTLVSQLDGSIGCTDDGPQLVIELPFSPVARRATRDLMSSERI